MADVIDALIVGAPLLFVYEYVADGDLVFFGTYALALLPLLLLLSVARHRSGSLGAGERAGHGEGAGGDERAGGGERAGDGDGRASTEETAADRDRVVEAEGDGRSVR